MFREMAEEGFEIRWVVLAIPIHEQVVVEVIPFEPCDPRAEGLSLAPALPHLEPEHFRPCGLCDLRRAIAGTVIHHEDSVEAEGAQARDDASDVLRFVVGGDDGRDPHGAFMPLRFSEAGKGSPVQAVNEAR